MTKTPLYVACGALTVAAALFFHLGAPAPFVAVAATPAHGGAAMAPVAAPTPPVVPTPTSAPSASALATTVTAPLPSELAINAPVVNAEVPIAPIDLNQANPWTNWQEFKPQAIRVTVAANLPLTFNKTSITTGVDGQTVWTGECPDAPGLTMVSSGTPSHYNAIVFGPASNEYHIATANGKTTIREINPSDITCGPELTPAKGMEMAAAVLSMKEGAQSIGDQTTIREINPSDTICAHGMVQAKGMEMAAAVLPGKEGDQSIVDLLFVYSADYAATAGSAEQIRNEFEARVAALNAILVGSKIDNMRWRAVGSMQAPAHAETSSMSDDVNWVTNNAEVAAKREAVAADQVLYEVLSDGAGYSKDYSGLAWRPSGSPTRSTSFAVVCGKGAALAAHELGHNFGCQHDRQTDNQLGNSTGYAYGHRFTYNGTDYGDIMSYANTLPYYSNPDVSYEGNPMGIAAGQVNAADCARWIREKAAAMANLFTPPGSGLTPEGFHYTDGGAGITITGYTGPGGAVTVPASISGKPVTTIGGLAFQACSGLTSITLPKSLSSIGSLAFYGCSALTSIQIDSENTSFASVDGVLFNKALAQLIWYPAGKPGTTYTVPSGVTSIGDSAFDRCEGLTSVTLPGSLSTIGTSAFTGCSGLSSVTLPGSLTIIGTNAFTDCSGLASVTIPRSVTSIGGSAFSGCSSLIRADFIGNAPPTFGWLVFNRTAAGFKVYYTTGASGFTSPIWNGYVTEVVSRSSRADFDGDGKSDVLLTNFTTGDRAMWLMNGATIGTNAFLSTVPLEWVIGGTGDFDGDGKADIFWSNTITGDRSVWLMNGSTMTAGGYLGSVPVQWVVGGTGDFDGDGKSDILWSNPVTGEHAIWLMNGITAGSGASLGVIPVEWMVSGTGDFNGDGKADILLSNTVTGDRALWLMNGSQIATNSFVSTVPVDWTVSGTGDLDGDGKADILWSNTITGDISVWLMNGYAVSAGGYLGAVPVAWTVNATGDYNGDGKADILWTNATTGEHAMWLMNGLSASSGASLGTVPVEWLAHH